MTSQESVELEKENFAKALGLFVWVWNDLHEGLGQLFSAVMRSGHVDDTALAVWHSQTSDRAQRKMLLVAAKHELATRPALLEEIKWLSKKTEALADKRNDAVHASYAFLHKSDRVSVIANSYYGNNRSQKLSKFDDLTERLIAYEGDASKLASFSDEVFQCVIYPDRDLPQRPFRK